MVKNKEYSKTSVTRALEIAINAHRGQFDIAGVEYIRHLMAVAASLNMKDPDAVVVALLHDVLEGTVVTVEDLAKDFPPKIINALRALTPQADEDYMSFIQRCAENPLARMVKIADLRHDMDPERLKNVKKDDRKQLRTKYASALNYLCRFIDKEELSRLLFEESSGLPSGTLPHDAMNKAAFVHDEMLESFLRYYVEESFIKDLDLTHIESLPGEFISSSMSKRYSDCIRKVRWKGRDAYIIIILEFQSTKDIWIPVRVLVYTGLIWQDLIKRKLVTKEEGLPPVFPIVVHSGSEQWDNPLSVQDLLAPSAKQLLKYQPTNLALLVDEKTIKDEVLNEHSDFYALYLALKRAKTPMAMREAVKKYQDVLAKPEHHELLKTIISIVETLYKRFNQDAGSSDVRFASLEEAVKMIDSTAIDWKKNTQEYFLNEFRQKERQEGIQEGIIIGEEKGRQEGIIIGEEKGKKKWLEKGRQEGREEGEKRTILALLQAGFPPEGIGKALKLPLDEIEKLKTQSV